MLLWTAVCVGRLEAGSQSFLAPCSIHGKKIAGRYWCITFRISSQQAGNVGRFR